MFGSNFGEAKTDSNLRLEIGDFDSRIDSYTIYSFGITMNTTPTVIWLMLQIRYTN